MNIVEVADLTLPDLAPYVSLTERQLRQADDEGILIAESPKVIMRGLEKGFRPLSLLCERKHIEGDASGIIRMAPEIPIYTGPRERLAAITGYELTRGVLCAMRRPKSPETDEILSKGTRICVLYDICDAVNVGAIIRTCAALGYDGLLLTPGTCDPFNRRALRVSMGAAFQIPWCFEPDIYGKLRKHGFSSVGMALRKESFFLQNFEVRKDGKYAIILGSEGYGLPEEALNQTDIIVKIPMHPDVDSLNVGAAAAIALWEFSSYKAGKA